MGLAGEEDNHERTGGNGSRRLHGRAGLITVLLSGGLGAKA